MYEQKEWKDHIVDEATGEVMQEGTPISASNMNRIENGIAQAHDELSQIGAQVTELESAKVKRYGVIFNGSNSQGTRVEDAVGMVANVAVDDEIVINDFDEISFFNRPICCGYHDDTGKFHVNAYRGEPGFAWDGSNGEVYYEETPFYWTGDLLNYVSVSTVPVEGYELSPRFKNAVDKVYSPVFWMGKEEGVDGKATSRAGVFPERNSLNGHMATARTYHTKAHTETMAARISDYILQLVEFATKDLQTVMMGASSMAYSSDDVAVLSEVGVNRIILANARADRFVVGQTIAIGTTYSNGSVADNRIITSIVEHSTENKAIYFDGAPVDITTGDVVASRAWKNGATNIVVASSGSPGSNIDGKHPCIWRGKVDPWGDAYSAICDVLIQRTGADTTEDPYVYTPYFLEDPTKYADGVITADYVELNYKLATENGYAKTLGLDSRFKHVRLTDAVGASSTTYLASYFYIISPYDIRVVFAGGCWYYGRSCGPVYFNCSHSPSYSSIHRLARLFVDQ